MKQYLELVNKIISSGDDRPDRTGTGTKAIFSHTMRFDLNEGFPIVTTKKTWFRGIAEELLWMISGSVDVKELQAKNVKIWDEWQKPDGTIGPGYGEMFRWISVEGKLNGKTVGKKEWDQLNDTIEQIKKNPYSRRHIISLWQVPFIEDMALPCCHGTVIQFYVSSGKLSCHMYQRSADVFLGLPFNIASYALFTHLVAQVTGLGVGELVITTGDSHIYQNHFEQACEMLQRKPMALPNLVLDPSVKNIEDFKYEHMKLEGYQSHPALKGEVSV